MTADSSASRPAEAAEQIDAAPPQDLASAESPIGDSQDGDISGDEQGLLPEMMPPAPMKKKKKGRNKSTAARGPTALPKSRGTGFEEYYADPPLTPQEAAEEKEEIYSPDLPFAERIQSCIQRYRGRRRMQTNLTVLFNEYLFLGGVDTFAKAYGGQDQQDLKDLTPAQRLAVTATDTVHGEPSANERFYTGDDENWSVDFAGVAAGFFSLTLNTFTGFDPKHREAAIGLVENFLKYVLHHDVCPEYSDNVKQAVRVCQDAREEWPVMEKLLTSMPGHFNLAAAEYFFQRTEEDWLKQGIERPINFHPKAVLFSTFALRGEEDLFGGLEKAPRQVERVIECTLEVVKIMRPATDIASLFKKLKIGDTDIRIPPMGKAIFKSAVIEDDWVQPELPAEYSLKPDQEVTLYFDDKVLSKLKVGMKMSVTLCELLGGDLHFIKKVDTIVPTFYTFLPQAMMRHFKTPEENDRPAPSVHNPDAEQAQYDQEAKDV